MPKFDPDDYLPVEAYAKAVEAFHGFCGMVLFEFSRHKCDTRDIIIRNFVARSDTMVRAVLQLWEMSDFQDCWILCRCLMDRLFHLSELAKRNEFDTFEAWSFYEQYNAQNRVRSDPGFQGAKQSSLFTPTSEQRERAEILSSDPPEWRRPKAEVVAKRLNMQFLYRFGYDYGSTHVHPMANDGQQDFFTITKLKPAPDFPDQRSVLSNSILVGSMTVQAGFNASSFRWRADAYDFLTELQWFLGTGSGQYEVKFAKLAQLFAKRIPLSEAT